MKYFLLFLIWIAAAFFFPRLLRRLQIPWVTAVILAGILHVCMLAVAKVVDI